MPGYDRTEPGGQGSRTGGGFGFCGAQARGEADTDIRGYGRGVGPGGRGLQRGFRKGFCFYGRGRGGAGYGPRWAAEPIQPDRIKSNLQAEAEDLRRRLETVEQRLAGIEGLGAEPKQA
jgi:hypothetical protein